MPHDILYKRNKLGGIVYWQVDVFHHNFDEKSTIEKKSGQLGTASPLTHRDVITKGKQGRTYEEQAEFDAQSDWNRKRDEGYKSLRDLGIDDDNNLSEDLQKALPKFNSDAQGNIKPMLAKAVNWDKVSYPCYVQPKLDGVRCLIIYNDGDIKFLSRSGKEYTTLSHISVDLTKAADRLPGTFILDGEIYSDELTFQQIVAAVKKQRDDSLKLKFRAYDIVNDQNQAKRMLQFQVLVEDIDSSNIIAVPTMVAISHDSIKECHDKWVAMGYEGAMIRLNDGMYGQGQRSSDLLKVKEFDETEFAFKNFEFGQRGVEDLIAVLWDSTGEKEFRAKMIGTKAEKEELYKLNDTAEGKSMTIKHFGMTTDGLPRFPVGKGFRLKEDT